MTKPQRNQSDPGFTLIELMIVIGILALLMALLFPALSKARRQATRLQDLNSIRQFGASCLAYAVDNKGILPNGTREQASATNGDDLVWLRFSMLQLLMKKYGMPASAMQCNSFWDGDSKQTFFKQYAPGYGSYIGWIYFGHRIGVGPPRQYPSGQPYVLPMSTMDHPTSKTLATCWGYVSPTTAWNGYLAHMANSDSVNTVAPTNSPQAPPEWNGLNVVYIDGSARWVPRSELAVVRDVDWEFYDPNY